MLVHIVTWKVVGPSAAQKTEQIARIRELLEQLPAAIPQLQSLHVGTNLIEGEQAADVVLNAEFADLDALRIYQQHPEHLKAAEEVAVLVCDRRMIDYLRVR